MKKLDNYISMHKLSQAIRQTYVGYINMHLQQALIKKCSCDQTP